MKSGIPKSGEILKNLRVGTTKKTMRSFVVVPKRPRLNAGSDGEHFLMMRAGLATKSAVRFIWVDFVT